MAIQRADEGMSVKEAAAYLGVHHQTIRKWIREGNLTVTRFGPSGWNIRIERKDLDAMRHKS